jgi:hypothetical protein
METDACSRSPISLAFTTIRLDLKAVIMTVRSLG